MAMRNVRDRPPMARIWNAAGSPINMKIESSLYLDSAPGNAARANPSASNRAIRALTGSS